MKPTNKQKSNEALVKKLELSERLAKLHELATEANQSSKQLSKLNEFLRDNADLSEHIRFLASTIKSTLIDKVCNESGTRRLLRVELDGLVKRLAGDEPTALESLILESVALCWLRLQYAEYYRTAIMNSEHSFQQIEFADKLLTQAQKRFFRALESLEKVRKLNAKKQRAVLNAVKVIDASTDS